MNKTLTKLLSIKDKIEKVDELKYKEIFSSLFDVISDVYEKNNELLLKIETLEENIGYIGEDLTDLQEEVFEEVSIEELNDMEDEYIEISCKSCKKPLFIEKDAMDKNTKIPCPFCSNMARE